MKSPLSKSITKTSTSHSGEQLLSKTILYPHRNVLFDQIMETTNQKETDHFYYTIAKVSEAILDAFIFFLAVVYITLMLLRKNFRSNKLSWPTINIAFTTALFALVDFIFAITHFNSWSVTSCRIQGFLVEMTACHIMYAYCTSSVTRFFVIRYFTKPIFRSTSWLCTSIGICWLSGCLSAIPHALYDSFACANSESPIIFKVYTCVTTVILPCLIVGVCNISIIRCIHQLSRRIHPVNSNKTTHNNTSNKRDMRITKIMLCTFCLFLLGWMPIFVEGLFLNSQYQLPPFASILFELFLPMSLLGQMILLIYANQPMCQFLKDKLKHNARFLFFIKFS